MLHWSHQFINLIIYNLSFLDERVHKFRGGKNCERYPLFSGSALFLCFDFKSSSPPHASPQKQQSHNVEMRIGNDKTHYVDALLFSALQLKWKKIHSIHLLCHISSLFSSPVNKKFRGDIQIFRDIAMSQSPAVKLIEGVTVIKFFLWPFRSPRLFISTVFSPIYSTLPYLEHFPAARLLYSNIFYAGSIFGETSSVA